MTNGTHCSGCDRDLHADEFAWKNKAKGTRQRWCRSCQREANRVHYQNNTQVYKDGAIERNNRVNAKNKQRLYAYLSEHECVDCGQADIRCLEFDHVRGDKAASITRMINGATSWKAIEAEIAKCEVRCVNCHRIKTNERGGWWRHIFPG